jgi:hypothetical protein
VERGIITIRAENSPQLLVVLAVAVLLDLHGLPLPSPQEQPQLLLSGLGGHLLLTAEEMGLTAEL